MNHFADRCGQLTVERMMANYKQTGEFRGRPRDGYYDGGGGGGRYSSEKKRRRDSREDHSVERPRSRKRE
jgi:hypothetical protein